MKLAAPVSGSGGIRFPLSPAAQRVWGSGSKTGRVLLAAGFLILGWKNGHAQEAKVRSSLSDPDPIWTGQRITLVVELLAPGFFSGTPAFDLPDPAGMIPSAMPVPASALPISLMVPSPPQAITPRAPPVTAALASSPAWNGRSVR